MYYFKIKNKCQIFKMTSISLTCKSLWAPIHLISSIFKITSIGLVFYFSQSCLNLKQLQNRKIINVIDYKNDKWITCHFDMLMGCVYISYVETNTTIITWIIHYLVHILKYLQHNQLCLNISYTINILTFSVWLLLFLIVFYK